ncbi:MAG TPA: phosphatase PAP2 family protein [Gemmatimonadaceae bacterium]|jgi:membrane-associated phospholipid phosphatase|nr:phosphatase PAP2 family protein [Gemmatimonadaceae bacterium]
MRPRSRARANALFIVCIVLASAISLDHWAYLHLVNASVYDHDWGRLLRIVGFWPTWAAASIALWLDDRSTPTPTRCRALLLVASPGLAGLVAEVLKLVLRRERPDAAGGHYLFRAFADRPFSSAGIGSPSSHAAVAFGAAMILSYMFPRARSVWLSLAFGCAVTRVLARAHFLSDVVGGAIIGVVVATWLHQAWRLRRLARAPSHVIRSA